MGFLVSAGVYVEQTGRGAAPDPAAVSPLRRPALADLAPVYLAGLDLTNIGILYSQRIPERWPNRDPVPPGRGEAAFANLGGTPLVDLPFWPGTKPTGRNTAPKGAANGRGETAYHPLPSPDPFQLSAGWAVQAFPPKPPAVSGRENYGFSLYAWNLGPEIALLAWSQPVRAMPMPPAAPGRGESLLPVERASVENPWLSWAEPAMHPPRPDTPRPEPFARQRIDSVPPPPWYACCPIIVAGPFACYAMQVGWGGAVMGQIEPE